MNRLDTSAFPSPELLARFFQADPREPVAIADAAALLGMSVFALRGTLRAEGGHPRGNSIRWSEVAAYLLDAWPRRPLLEAIERAAGPVLPPKFRLMRVDWRLPIFLVQAMQHQARQEPAPGIALPPRRLAGRPRESSVDPSVEDYVSDLLFAHIAPETIEQLRADEKFLRAYLYPVQD